MNVLPITREGALLSKLRHMFGSEAQIQEGDIRLEKVLTPTSVAERFNLNGEGTGRRPLEVFIGLNDLVVPYALKVALNKIDTTLNGNNGNVQDITYPDPNVFPLVGVAPQQSEANCLNAIYSGNISLKANTIEILNTMQLRRFKVIPETQASATTIPQNTPDGGWVPILQPAIFSGRDTNIMEFNPSAGSDVSNIGGRDGEQNILVFHFKVMVVRNGAQPTTWTQVSEILDKYTQDRVIL